MRDIPHSPPKKNAHLSTVRKRREKIINDLRTDDEKSKLRERCKVGFVVAVL